MTTEDNDKTPDAGVTHYFTPEQEARDKRERECMSAFEANYCENENGENPPSRLQGGGYANEQLACEYAKFRIGYFACAAQSSATISRLENEKTTAMRIVAKEIKRTNRANARATITQADNVRLQDGFLSIRSESINAEHVSEEMLNQPLDTTALDAHVEEKTAELRTQISNLQDQLNEADRELVDYDETKEKLSATQAELASMTGALEISEKMGKAVVQQFAAAQAVIKGKDDALRKIDSSTVCGTTLSIATIREALALTPNQDVLDEYVREQMQVAVANLPESVIDAPRYFLQGLELGIKNCRPMREHMRLCGCEIDYLPAWFLDDSTTYITKAGKAIIIYAMMVHALPPTTKEGR